MICARHPGGAILTRPASPGNSSIMGAQLSYSANIASSSNNLPEVPNADAMMEMGFPFYWYLLKLRIGLVQRVRHQARQKARDMSSSPTLFSWVIMGQSLSLRPTDLTMLLLRGKQEKKDIVGDDQPESEGRVKCVIGHESLHTHKRSKSSLP